MTTPTVSFWPVTGGDRTPGKPMTEIVHKKRGRKSGRELVQEVGLALKNLQEFELLEESPLGRLPAVRHLAESTYHESYFATAFALRALLLEGMRALIQDFSEMPNYRRELRFLSAFVQGESVAAISRDLGLSREHVARTIQPKAFGLVATVFLALANKDGVNGAVRQPERTRH